MSTVHADDARALAAPTRRAIVAHLSDTGGPLSVAELTVRLGLNHNAVRKHLAHLVRAGLVAEETDARGVPGRPRRLYRSTPRREPYQQLAALLATTLATGADPVDVGRAAAQQDDATGSVASDDPVGALRDRFAADGFDPTMTRRGGGHSEIVLRRCPFATAAAINPEAVCALHLGLAEGTAARIGGVRVDRLDPRDPHEAGCCLALTERPRSDPDV